MNVALALSMLSFATSSNVLCQQIKTRQLEPFPLFTAIDGQTDSDGFPISGAKLCLREAQDRCYQMPSQVSAGPGKVTYEFGLEPRARQLLPAAGGSLVLFSAMFSGGGSGTLTRLAVLRYDRSSKKIINLLPFVGITNLGGQEMWTLPNVSDYPVLVDADFLWGDRETHFDPHFYTVEAWKFDPKADRYSKVLSYRTAGKYESETLDGRPPRNILRSEERRILQQLQTR